MELRAETGLANIGKQCLCLTDFQLQHAGNPNVPIQTHTQIHTGKLRPSLASLRNECQVSPWVKDLCVHTETQLKIKHCSCCADPQTYKHTLTDKTRQFFLHGQSASAPAMSNLQPLFTLQLFQGAERHNPSLLNSCVNVLQHILQLQHFSNRGVLGLSSHYCRWTE